MTVYFFDKPTIGYCPECDEIAIYIESKGLICPKCKSKDLSLFVWDENSKYPE
jgi:Zn finger protein HypA/HybF involved in hydrogenase expression